MSYDDTKGRAIDYINAIRWELDRMQKNQFAWLEKIADERGAPDTWMEERAGRTTEALEFLDLFYDALMGKET